MKKAFIFLLLSVQLAFGQNTIGPYGTSIVDNFLRNNGAVKIQLPDGTLTDIASKKQLDSLALLIGTGQRFDSVKVSSANTGNFYIGLDNRLHYLVNGYWYRLSVQDSTAAIIIPSLASIMGDGNTAGWYRSDTIGTITMDGSNKVTQWNDISGNSHNLAASSNDFTPTWTSNGIHFDGVYNYMAATFTLNDPTFIYMVCKVYSTNTDYSYFLGGIGSAGFYTSHLSSSPEYLAVSQNQLITTNMISDQFIVLRVLLNGISTKALINGSSVITGDGGATNMGGLTLGSQTGVGYGGSHSQIDIKEVIVRKTSDNSTNENVIYTYLKNKYGL